MEKKYKNLDEKERYLVSILQKSNKKDHLKPEEFFNTFVRVRACNKNSENSNLGRDYIFYCIQLPDPKKKNICSIEALGIDKNNSVFSPGKLTFSQVHRQKKEVLLDKVITYPEFRRLGIGSELIRVFEETCTSALGDKVKIDGLVLPDEEGPNEMRNLINFYQKNGYEIVKDGPSVKINKTLRKKFSLFKNITPYSLGE